MPPPALALRPPPLLIWTLQRSGGTNLTRRLEGWCGLAAAEHEPFNREREFGALTVQWEAEADLDALHQAMHQACASRGLIKHCVELVPWEISEALAHQSVALGYRHLFLYREQPRDRLLSLTFAKRTGVWAPGKAREELDDVTPVLEDALPVNWLIERETLCAQRLNAAWGLLRELGAQPVALSFESVYKVPQPQAEARLSLLLAELGLARRGDAAATQRFLADVLARGDQGTSKLYDDFRGVQRLERALETVERFRPE
jgi:hypothetical protein